MSTDNWRDEIGPQVLTLQIVVAALVAGCLFFLAIVVFMVQIRDAQAVGGDSPLMTYIGMGFACTFVVARVVILRIIESRARKRIADGTWQVPESLQPLQHPVNAKWVEQAERLGDRGKLLIVMHIRTIVGAALLEGSAFFLLITYLIEQSPLALAAAIVLIIGVALHFPTRSSAVHWIEDQLAAIKQLRQFGS